MSLNEGSEDESTDRPADKLVGGNRSQLRKFENKASQGFDEGEAAMSNGTERLWAAAKSAGVSDALCKEVIQGFAGRASVGMSDAAKILRMHVKTLRIHVADGTISFIQKGTGTERARRIFTPTDLLEFYAGQRRRATERGNAIVRRFPRFE
jgi:hypothetical protein